MQVVNRESQSMLAKLLAKENITIQSGNYKTAFFDLKNRILGLPRWNVENKSVSDLMVGHEVGHALYTPSDAITLFQKAIPGAPFAIANIVEDIRIERLIQSKYPGLSFRFKGGYKYFITNDFFQIKDVEISTLGFLDRLNLKGKIGSFVKVPLSTEEEQIYQRCVKAETYETVLEICKDIYALVKSKNEKQQKNSTKSEPAKSDPSEGEPAEGDPAEGEGDSKADPSEGDPSEGDGESKALPSEGEGDSKADPSEGEPSEGEGDSKADPSEGDPTEGDPTEGEGDSKADPSEGEPSEGDFEADPSEGFGNTKNDFCPKYENLEDEFSALTQDRFDENVNSLQSSELTYHIANNPTWADFGKSIISVATVMESRREMNPVAYQKLMDDEQVDAHWTSFKIKTKKEISVLIREFDRRKSAFQYSRSQQSASGSIDLNRLHSYKYEDNIFKSVTRLADAKNHGMVFFIDYSGSMTGTIRKVLTQTMQLVLFCKAVGIPFSVYGFTGPTCYDYDYESKPGYSIDFRRTNIFELVNSKMSKSAFDLACKELYINGIHYSVGAFSSKFENMSSTPLVETIIVAHEIIKRFKEKHNVQKMNAIFLTDGLSQNVYFVNNKSDRDYRNPIKGSEWNAPFKVNINGREIELNSRSSETYSILIENLKITTGATVIGFFIPDNVRDLKTNLVNGIRFSKNNKVKLSWGQGYELFKKYRNESRKSKCMMIAGAHNYDMYFAFPSRESLTISAGNKPFMHETENDYSKASAQNALAKDFTAHTLNKKMEHLFLQKFAEIIS